MANQKRIKRAVSAGEEAFWAAVATQFPEAKKGNLPDDMATVLTLTMERAIRT